MSRQSIFSGNDIGKPEIADNGTSGETGKPVAFAVDSIGAIDPASIATETPNASGDGNSGGNSGDGIRPKRKYRKRGSAAQSGQTLSVEACAAILLSGHSMLARMSRNPVWEIEKDEAERFAKASADLAAHYGFSPSSKSVAWTNFIMAAGEIYGTRMYVTMQQSKARHAASRKSNGANPPQAEPMQEPIQWPPYDNDGQHNVN